MEKGIILYQSKYGSTKKYAYWLAESTGYDCEETRKARIQTVKQYETIVMCGGIYASGIAGISFLKKNMDELANKRVMVFCAGASPYDEKAIGEIKVRNFGKEKENIPLFYGRGAWNEKNMSFMDRMLCRLLQKSIEKREPQTYEPWMKALMSAQGKGCDWTDKRYLEPLFKALDEHCSGSEEGL